MKKLKKFLAALLAATMATSGLTAVVNASDSWYDLEAENGVNTSGLTHTVDGNTYVYVENLENQSVTVTADVEADAYDIWALIGLDDYDSQYPRYGHYEFFLNDETEPFAKRNNTKKDMDWIDGGLYETRVFVSYKQTYMQWVKVGEAIGLDGETSIRVDFKRDVHACCSVDKIRLVPSSWNYVATDLTTEPSNSNSGGGNEDDEEDDDIIGGGDNGDEDDEVVGDNDPTVDGYIHAEAENALYFEDAYSVHTREEASSGKVLVPKDSANPDDTAVEFNVTIPETTGYDVYALVALKDYSSSAWRLMVDGVSYDQQMNVGAGTIYNVNINLGYNRRMSWVKMAGNIELTEGDATIVAYLPSKTYIVSYLTGIDAIRLVPTNWFWAPNNSLDVPVKTEISDTTNEDGTLLIEAENGIMSGSMNKVSYANASGGAYASVKSTSTAGNVKLDFNTLEEETYDIWAAIATNPVNWLGGYVFTLDDTEIYNKCLLHVDTSNPDLYGEKIVLHNGNSSESASTIRWVKIGEKQTLSAGEHEIVAGTRGGSGVENATGLIDCIAFVPSSWKWTGSDYLELPEKPEVIPDDDEDDPIVPEPGEVITTDWFDIEVETGTAVSGTLRTNTAGDKKYISAAQGIESALGVTNSFATEKAGTYDIWAVVGTHSGGNNLGSYTFTLDGVVLASNISAGLPTYDSANVLYTGVQVAQGYPMNMVWTKVAEDVELAEGTHTLVSEITSATSVNGNKYGAMDMVRFVPSNWNWTQDANFDVPHICVDTSVLETLLADAEKITEDMVSSTLFSEISAAISATKSVLENEYALQEDVDIVAENLDALLKSAIKETRDILFDALAEYKGLDGGILDEKLFSEYETAYEAGRVGFWDADKTALELYMLTENIKTTFDAVKNTWSVTEKVLTGNVNTEADRTYYPGMESDKLPNLSYEWTGAAGKTPNPEASGQDKNFGYTRLLSGVANTPWDNAPNICWGQWSWYGTTNLDFNLGEEAYVTGADFWENAGGGAGTNYCSDKVEAYTSDDGVTWKLQKSMDVDQSDTPNSLKGTRLDFDEPVKCRYVRVAVIDNTGYQVKFNEVVIRGYRTTQVKTAPVVIEDIDYATTGSKGERILSLDGQKRVKVTGNVKNATPDERDVIVVSVAYKDGDIIDFRYVKKTLAGFASTDFGNTMQLDEETGLELHTFVWDSFGSATPLSKIYTFGLDEHEMASFAAEGTGAEFDIDSERLRVWGTADGKGDLQDTTVIVLRAGVTNEDIDSMTKTSDVQNAILYVEQTSQENGMYAFESFPADTTKYYGNNNVYVTNAKGEQTFYRLLYLDNKSEQELIEAFQDATSSTMRSVIDSNEFLIKGVRAVDEIIAKYDKDTVLNSVAGMILDTEYETGAELLAEILAAVALTDLNNVATKAEAIASIDGYCEEFGIAKNSIYTDLYNGEDYVESKVEVSEKFVGQSYASKDEFVSDFYDKVTVNLINDAESNEDIICVINAAREFLSSVGFEMDKYDILEEWQVLLLCDSMLHKEYESVNEIEGLFNKVVNDPGSVATITGTSNVCVGDKNIAYSVTFTPGKENIGYAILSIRYPNALTLKSVEKGEFVEVEIDKTETDGEYTTTDVLCIYSYDGKVLLPGKEVSAFDIYFDVSKTITPQDIEIEVTEESILIGDEDYPFTKLVSAVTTINPKLPESIAIISGADSIDEPTKYTAEILPDYTTDKSVIWSVDDEDMATISEDGVLTPLKSGTVTIIATAAADENVKATKTVRTIAYAKIESIVTDGFWVEEFATKKKEYTIYVDEDAEKFNISASYKLGTLKINGSTLISGRTKSIELPENETRITVARTNVSGFTDVTYIFNIIKNSNPLICSEESGTYRVIFNKKKIDLSEGGHLMIALYDENDAVTGLSDAEVFADDAEKTVEISSYGTAVSAKVMLWKGLSDVMPLCTASNIILKQ